MTVLGGSGVSIKEVCILERFLPIFPDLTVRLRMGGYVIGILQDWFSLSILRIRQPFCILLLGLIGM